MKRINAVLRTSLVRPFRFRSFIAGLVVSLLMIFTLFLSGGQVVEADTSIGNVPGGTHPNADAGIMAPYMLGWQIRDNRVGQNNKRYNHGLRRKRDSYREC